MYLHIPAVWSYHKKTDQSPLDLKSTYKNVGKFRVILEKLYYLCN